jgi:hypothetical protein
VWLRPNNQEILELQFGEGKDFWDTLEEIEELGPPTERSSVYLLWLG